MTRLAGELGSVPTAEFACIVPTYRRPAGVRAAIESMLAQDFADLVVMVVDDGAGLGDLPADPRVHAVSLSRNTAVLGLVRNVGIRLTRSRFVAFLDDDNTWTPDHLSRCRSVLLDGADLAYTDVGRYHPDGTLLDTLSRDFDRRALSDESYVDANSVTALRRPGLLFSRLPRTRATLPKEDWEFVFRHSGRGRRVVHVPHTTVRYLVNPDSFYTSWGDQ
ncbi:glycosyltransferase family 2 protein [Aquipuribacter sp. MA13-6]|uniref:glycosyltransferase family 2 protein n=1 Tax=unclassified Aquipuribacter TaxID=2635084 RepID=UPI003EEFC73C